MISMFWGQMRLFLKCTTIFTFGCISHAWLSIGLGILHSEMARWILEENSQNDLMGAHLPILENTQTHDYNGDHSDLRICLGEQQTGVIFPAV